MFYSVIQWHFRLPLVSRWLSRPGGEGRLSIPARYPLLPPGSRVEDHPNHCSPLTHPNKPSQRCVTVLVFLPSSGRLYKLARPTNKRPGRTSGRFGSISCYMRHVNVHETTKQFVWISVRLVGEVLLWTRPPYTSADHGMAQHLDGEDPWIMVPST